jgi:hypothetical protein
MTRRILTVATLAAAALSTSPLAHAQTRPDGAPGTPPVAQPAAAVLQRHALVIGANFGGADRPRLRYAVSDAERFAAVMVELGGVAPANQILLREPTLRDLFAALDALRTRLAAPKRTGAGAPVGRTEIVLYYSGHADEKGLLLGEDRVSYLSLRDRLDDLPADVRIAVLDACASGAFTRLKGGTARKPFTIDASSAMRGHAFLTSSAATEAAQESDRIGASYFTHYLVSGFRGAADLSRDGRVTLSEAYQFAFAETLGRTIGTAGGAQHPSYDINLSGTGDVVMTDMRQTTAAIVLGEDVDGRVFIRNGARQLVVELHKPAGRQVEIGVEPGAYEIRLQRERGAYSTRAQAAKGARVALGAQQFAAAAVEPTRSRGEAGATHAMAGRTRVSVVNGLWGDRGFVNLGGRRFDLFGGAQVTRFLTEDWAVAAGVEAFGANADTDIVGGLAIPLTLQWHPLSRNGERKVKPFVAGGPVVVSRSEGGSVSRLTAFGLQIGSGVDVHVKPRVSLTFRGAWNIVPVFGGPTWPSNYKGLQFSIGAGWLFGQPR